MMSDQWNEIDDYLGCKVYAAWDIHCDTSPREWDNLSHIWCWHRRYRLGDDDKNKPDEREFNTWQEMAEHIEKTQHPLHVRMIRMYDHSGIALSLGTGYPFNDAWDSGWVGFIFVTKEDVRKNYMVKRITKEISDRAFKCMLAEFETYDAYVRGEVYGYKVTCVNPDTDEEEEIDSCWGFYGDEGKKCMKEEARASIERYRKTHLLQRPLPMEVGA